jgi:hypothetical protein
MEAPLNPLLPADREKLWRLFLMKKTEGAMLSQRGYMLHQVAVMKLSGSSSSFPIETWLPSLQNPLLGMTPPVQGVVPAEEEPTLSNDSAGFRAFLQHRAETGYYQSRQEFSSIYYDVNGKPLVVLYLANRPGKQVSKEEFEIVNTFIQLGAQQGAQPQMRFRDFILITETGLNPVNTNKLRNRTLGYNIEVFLDSELAFARVKHCYAPITVEHIPKANVARWGQQEQIQPEKLPMEMNLDAIAKWFGAVPFDVLQTELLGTTTDTIGYARIVRQTPVKQ